MSLLSKAQPMNKEAEKAAKLKLFVYGEKSTGKTHLALNAPGPILFIDTENGTDPFLNRAEFSHLLDGKNVRIKTTSVADVTDMLKELAGSNRFGTVVIDSFTNLYYTLQNANLGKQGKPETANWNVIKLAWKDMLVALANLSCNVIGCSQEKAGVKGHKEGNYMKYEQEITFDCDDSTPYFADLGLRVTRTGKVVTGEVIKEDRYGRHPMGKMLQGVTFEKLLQGIGPVAPAPTPAPTVAKVSTVAPSVVSKADSLREAFESLHSREEIIGFYQEEKASGLWDLTTLQSVYKDFYSKFPATEKVSA